MTNDDNNNANFVDLLGITLTLAECPHCWSR